MMKEHREKFYLEGSPLVGCYVPRDWRRLDRPGKWAALVDAGIARSAEEARCLLAGHAAAVAKVRRERVRKGGRYGG